MKKFGLTGEQEGEFSMIKEIAKLICNGHANHMKQNSVVRIQAENLMPEKPNKQLPALSKCFMQQSHLSETVKKDLILNMTPETRSKTFPNLSKSSLFSPTPKETTEPKRHIQR